MIHIITLLYHSWRHFKYSTLINLIFLVSGLWTHIHIFKSLYGSDDWRLQPGSGCRMFIVESWIGKKNWLNQFQCVTLFLSSWSQLALCQSELRMWTLVCPVTLQRLGNCLMTGDIVKDKGVIQGYLSLTLHHSDLGHGTWDTCCN